MAESFLIAPSLLSADFANLKTEIESVEAAGADWLHLDIMDGHFVPNLTFGAPVVQKLKAHAKCPLDVHLMIENPEKYIDAFIDAGADYLTLHIEACKDAKADLNKIKSRNVKCGITLRPGTKVELLEEVLSLVDLVLVMTVEPGFGGQSFMVDQVKKIEWLVAWRKAHKAKFLIEVDGGVNAETARLCRGADVLVAGSYIFKKDYAEAIRSLKLAKGIE